MKFKYAPGAHKIHSFHLIIFFPALSVPFFFFFISSCSYFLVYSTFVSFSPPADFSFPQRTSPFFTLGASILSPRLGRSDFT